MSDCLKKLTQNITYDSCTPALRAKTGLETKAVIINRSDLDFTAITESGATVTNLSLMSGATGYSINWVKQLGNTASAYSVNDGLDTYNHSFICRVFGQSASDAEIIKELGEGEFLVVVETKFKGVDQKDAYKIFGLESGLKKSEGTFSSIENDGSYVFTLSSVEGFGESYPYKVYLETDYTTTKTKFDALFAS
ncbi:MAG TPA: hypothetical protein PLL09_04725 [Flavobacterium sp.]|uniref:hypothetical protein n=1 Tax=unclassified Flavobacterium TaxID=196869 RepID=UPI0025BD0DF1|nr:MULTISPECIES: hypothetical protein [unclassified Flavobacterium]HRE77113.1 hypothetical protein [Flavobacterium sp.]